MDHLGTASLEAAKTELFKHFDAMFEAMADGVWICDATPRLLWINSACEQLNDIHREEVCGQLVSDLLAIGNFDTDVSNRVIRTGKPVAINQKVKSGRTLLVSGIPVFDDEGELAYILGNERDLTELNLLREEVDKNRAINRKINSELLALKLREINVHGIVAESDAMERAMETALRVANFDTSVLVTGPSGVGKSLIAKVIHQGSSRAEKPFMTLNCGAIPQSLLEAELFGYVGGAFSGASSGGKPGLIEVADGGSLFLDEIDAFPLEAQVKLLTFLDTQSFIRVGGTRLQEVDIRLIAATNKDLSALVAKGTFREDLWFRLNVVPVDLPALKDRKPDIAPLIQNILKRLSKRYGIEITISPEAVDALCRYDFPGNVRELENTVERAFVLCQTGRIELADISPEIRNSLSSDLMAPTASSLREAIEHVEREWLTRARQASTRQIDMANELGVSQPTVARLLKKHAIGSES